MVFRLDAGPDVGLGHLRRCATLATALRDRACAVRFVSRDAFAPSVQSLAAGHPAVALGKPGDGDAELWDAEATLRTAGRADDASWVVVDSYALGERWERRLHDAGFRVMAIDDFRNRKHHADLLVSDTEAPFDPSLNERRGRTLVGRKYALIGAEYAYGETHRKPGTRVLITYGAADAGGETLQALSAVRSRQGLQCDVVIGPLNRMEKEIRRQAENIAGITLHVAPAGLAPLMRSADLVLTAGGNSLVEALSLRKPCLVTVTADNQELMVRQLAAEGVIRVAKAGGIAEALGVMLADLAEFSTRVAERAVFDHLGPQRVAAAMLEAR